MAKKNQKRAKDCNTINLFLQTNAKAEKSLLKQMDPESTSENCMIVNATLEHFAKLSKDQLKCFAIVRKLEVLKRSFGLPANKGDLEMSMAVGSNTLIRAAYDFRMTPVKLKAMPLVEAATVDALARGPRAVPMAHQMYARGETSHLRHKVTVEYIEVVKKAYDPFGVTVLTSNAADLDLATIQERSNILHDILQERLMNHIGQKCPKFLRNHYYWYFVQNNIGREATTMVVMQHIKDDIEPAKWDQMRVFYRVYRRMFSSWWRIV